MAIQVNKSDVFSCIKLYYNKTTEAIEYLDAYENANIKVITKSDNLTSCHASEFVLKLTKLENRDYMDFQIRMICHLQEKGIKTLKPVKTVHDNFIYKHAFSTKNHGDHQLEFAVCMFEYVPGKTVYAFGNPDSLLSGLGRLIGEMDSALLEFKEESNDFTNGMWEFTRFPEIENFLSEYCEMRSTGQEILDTYNKVILSVLPQFQRGFIHGDVNNCNIIVQKQNHFTNDTTQYTIAAIIDFGDACVSYYVYELACLLADMMTSTFNSHGMSCLDVGRQILHGYMEFFTLNKTELRHLRVVVCIRLLQMYILNSQALRRDPDNKYIGIEIEECGTVCGMLWSLTEEEFNSKFMIQI